MTTDQINTIQPGPELDRAIAEIIGVIPQPLPDKSPPAFSPIDTRGFKPSTDWNDAIFAAERFGLFQEHVFLSRSKHFPQWTITREECCIEDGEEPWHLEIATAPTGPLAICRAILYLHQVGWHPVAGYWQDSGTSTPDRLASQSGTL